MLKSAVYCILYKHMFLLVIVVFVHHNWLLHLIYVYY